MSQSHAVPATFTWPSICTVFPPSLSPYGIWRQPHVTSLLMIPWLFWAVTSAPCSEHLTVTLLPVLIPLLLLYKYPAITLDCAFLQMSAEGKDRWIWLQGQSLKGKWLKNHMLFPKQILPALPRMSLLKKRSRKHLQKQMLPHEPMFSMDINKGCRKTHNETQTKAKGKWQKPVRTTMDSWRSELTEVCK